MRHRPILHALTALLVISGCATLPSSREDPLQHLEKVLWAYIAAHPAAPYPKDAAALAAFAASNGAPFDRAAIDIDVSSGKEFVLVRYTLKIPERTEGQIAIGEKLH